MLSSFPVTISVWESAGYLWPKYSLVRPDIIHLPMCSRRAWVECSDTQHWEQMRAFHSNRKGWPTPLQLSQQLIIGESVLLWMMLQPTLDTAWHHTYAWFAQLNHFPTPDRLTLQDWLLLGDSISKALWNSQSNCNLPMLRPCHVANLQKMTT